MKCLNNLKIYNYYFILLISDGQQYKFLGLYRSKFFDIVSRYRKLYDIDIEIIEIILNINYLVGTY